jgi:hypothetical protein
MYNCRLCPLSSNYKKCHYLYDCCFSSVLYYLFIQTRNKPSGSLLTTTSIGTVILLTKKSSNHLDQAIRIRRFNRTNHIMRKWLMCYSIIMIRIMTKPFPKRSSKNFRKTLNSNHTPNKTNIPPKLISDN